MTSSNGNIFRVTGPLCGEFTGHRWIPRTKASDAELLCFLWSAAENPVEQTIVRLVIWDAIAAIVTSLQCFWLMYNFVEVMIYWHDQRIHIEEVSDAIVCFRNQWKTLHSNAYSHWLNPYLCDCGYIDYRKISNIRRTKSQNLNVSRLGLQVSLRNILKPSVKWRM